MNYQHQQLANGRWAVLRLSEQLANVGSEVIRALNWTKKGNQEYSKLAADRSLELLWLTIDDPRNKARLKELTRLYETTADYFFGHNEYKSSSGVLENYFLAFTHAARINNKL